MSGSTRAFTLRAPAGAGRAAGGGTGMAGDWPLRDAVELGALPGAVPCARLHARQLLWEWGLTGLAAGTCRH